MRISSVLLWCWFKHIVHIWVRILNDVQLAISDLEHFYYTWFAPSYSETISFGVVVKSTIRAFRKHILYIPLLVFVHHTGLQINKKWQKWCFYTFSFFWNHPVNYKAPLLILSNYSVNLVCLGPVLSKIGGLRANIWSQGAVEVKKVIKKERPWA